MNAPNSLRRSISPPPVTPGRKSNSRTKNTQCLRDRSSEEGQSKISDLAAIEAGKATVSDHLTYFSRRLSQVVKPLTNSEPPRLSISGYGDLYNRNCHPHGHHFVINEHNHPVAGCHYDLRLQFSESSSCSFAIPYGLPGNPNSSRQGRMAIETRIHTLWNNLIESASHATGSLLIWDTGEYEILPRKMTAKKIEYTDDECSDYEEPRGQVDDGSRHDNEKFIEAFKTRYIRLRLHGIRLPKGYTITLRLPVTNDVAKHSKPMRRKRKPSNVTVDDSETDSQGHGVDELINNEVGLASDNEDDKMTKIRATNAYIGADNSIGSIHQRRWFITLDRSNSGFVKENAQWVRAGPGRGFEPFYVRGAGVETSVVTGRTSAEVMADEGVEGFVPRKRWRAVFE